MKILCLFLLLPTVFAQAGFGTSYLKNSRLCHEWNCINNKLGLPDSLPPREQYTAVLKSLLPQGAWQNVVDRVLDVCYGDRPRRFVNTCPGQALMQCTVDQLITNCPEENWRKNDACSPVSSLAGLKHMFSQSLYADIERNLPREHRPTWFLKNYFNVKCCNLPPLFDMVTLAECGFSELVHYYINTPKYDNAPSIEKNLTTPPPSTIVAPTGTLKIVDLKDFEKANVAEDPLDCCDMSEFIKPSWRTTCGFHLTWVDQDRLVIGKNTLLTSTEKPASTTTTKPRTRDRMLLPQACDKETCVFQKLNIINGSGVIDMAAYIKLLDNFTNTYPSWNKAKARVITTCLTKPLTEYEADCEINKILACTLDVLTENCPYTQKNDICKHSKEDIICQISSSKYRGKNRRSTCYLPEIVHGDYLQECGLNSLTRIEHALEFKRKRTHSIWPSSNFKCQELTSSTSCLMSSMGIMNKYGFMDYFIMKDKIRDFTSKPEWAALKDVVLSSFVNIPMYRQHCSSSKKLLNVIDAMIMTCPITRRKNTPQCTKIFTQISQNTPERNMTQEKLQQILNHFQHVFLPNPQMTTQTERVILPKIRHAKKVVKTPIYNFGLLNSESVPPVRIINIKPTSESTTGVLLPVYMRLPIYRKNLILSPYKNMNVLRSAPLVNTPQVHHTFRVPISTTPSKSISTTGFHISTKPPISTSTVRIIESSELEMSERM